jgi:hypothetical protein
MRSYFRTLPDLYERKAFGTSTHPAYSGAQIACFMGVLCFAEQQPERGRFKSRRLLTVLLDGPHGEGKAIAKHLGFLIEQRDVTELDDGSLVVEGWDELQEGNWQVAERMTRYRARKHAVTLPTVTVVTPDRVTAQSRVEVEAVVEAVSGGRPAREADDDDPAFPLRQWLAAHSAAVRDGDGYHRKLCQLVATDSGKTCDDVIVAFERLKANGARTSKQFVMGAEDALFPTIKVDTNKAPTVPAGKYAAMVEEGDDPPARPLPVSPALDTELAKLRGDA